MAAVSLLRDTNMAAVTSRENTQYIKLSEKYKITYLLLTEFEVRTVSYGPSFFSLIYKSTGKNEDP